MKPLQIAVLLTVGFAQALLGQTTVQDLSVELDAGQITLESATGNGASSGNAVEGYLINQRSVEVSVDISLKRPLFMRNRGRGQNMIATHVYLGGGQYQSDGRRSFISLMPKQRTRVEFVAYCVDFEKDNPAATDAFTIDASPSNLDAVVAAIGAYSRLHPDEDITSAAQAAIWMVQGVSIEHIRTKFEVSQSEETLARTFMK